MMFNKLKYKIFISIAIIFIFSLPVFADYSDVPKGAYYKEAVNSLSAMGIIDGVGNNMFKPEQNVTRAQFAKMAIMALGKEDEAKMLKSSTVFSDVGANHWAAGYINIAVKNNIITGYADGTFKPDENINFAQVVTVLLRTLGYGSAEMTGVWPQNYIEKAKGLDVTKNINLKPSNKVNRADIAVMLERTLNTKKNASTQILAEQSGLGTTKTCIITNSWELDSAIPKGIIKTDIGDFRGDGLNGMDYLGEKINLLVDSDNKIISAQSVEQDSYIMMVEGISGSRIEYADKKGSGTLNISDNMTFYYKGQKSTFIDLRQNISAGSVIALALAKGNSGTYDYGVLVDPPTYEPVVVKKEIGLNDKTIGTIAIADRNVFAVFKNGAKTDFSQIQMFDVVYLVKNPYKYGKAIILVYDDKTTGTYDDALPSKSSVNKIKILGKEMDIETSNAAAKLNESAGAFAIGDQITVLTGKSGKIVDVIPPSSTDTSNIAVIVNTRESISTDADTQGKKIFYAKLYKVDGTTTEYEVNEDESEYKGKLVRFDVKDDKADITAMIRKPISGRINIGERMLGDSWLSQSALIWDVQSNYGSQDVKVKTVRWQDMPSGEITLDKVTHAEMGGAFNDIQLLVLNNFTEAGQYGILISKNEKGTSASYSMMINGEQTTLSSGNTIFSATNKDVMYIEQDENGLQKMQTLNSKDTTNEIQAVDSRRIKINNKVYKLAKDVQIYDITGTTPVSLSVNDLSAGKVASLALYSGTQPGSQDLIKLITINNY